MIRFRLLLVAGLLTGFVTSALAQVPYVAGPDTLRIRSLERGPHWVVSVAPLALFDPENTVLVGVERLLAGRHSLLAEVGYGPRALNIWRPGRFDESGGRETWRGRAEWRIYLGSGSHMKRPPHTRVVAVRPMGRYVAFDLFYKQVNSFETGTMGRACEDGTCQYYQQFRSPVRKSVWAGHVKLGHQRFLDVSPDSRLLIDVYIGLGLRQRTISHDEESLPDDAGQRWVSSGGFTNGLDYLFTPNVSTGFRIGYAF